MHKLGGSILDKLRKSIREILSRGSSRSTFSICVLPIDTIIVKSNNSMWSWEKMNMDEYGNKLNMVI